MPIRDILLIGCGALHSAWVGSAFGTIVRIAQSIASSVVLSYEQIESKDSQRFSPSGRRLENQAKDRVGGALGFGLS